MIKIEQIEVEIFAISISGPNQEIYTENFFLDLSSNVATDSLRYIKCINLHLETMISGVICIIYPQNLFFLDP